MSTGSAQESRQTGCCEQSGSAQSTMKSLSSSWELLQFSGGVQPEATIAQKALQTSCPPANPIDSQVLPPKSLPSHCSSGSFTPLPQLLTVVVVVVVVDVVVVDVDDELDVVDVLLEVVCPPEPPPPVVVSPPWPPLPPVSVVPAEPPGP